MQSTKAHNVSVLNKFEALLSYTNTLNLERSTENFLEVAALLMKRPMLKIGDPGTNKSGSAKTIFSCFTDAKVKRIGLTANSTADQVFGGLIVEYYLQGKQVFNLEEGAANFEFVIFDEIFKVENADLLNKLLFFFDEESEIFQDGKMQKTKLEAAILTSNELPLPGSHDALMNRITIKASVSRLQSGNNRKLMLSNKHKNISAPKLVLNDLYEARKEAVQVTISDSILNLLICDEEYERLCGIAQAQDMTLPPLDQSRALVDKLAVQGVKVSDRQIVQLFGQRTNAPSFLQAVAWLSGSHEVTEDHLVFLLNTLWSNEQEIPKIQEVLKTLDTTAQYSQKVQSLHETFTNFKNLADGTDREKQIKRSAGLSQLGNISEAINSLNALNSTSPKVLGLLAELSSMRDTTELIVNSLGRTF